MSYRSLSPAGWIRDDSNTATIKWTYTASVAQLSTFVSNKNIWLLQVHQDELKHINTWRTQVAVAIHSAFFSFIWSPKHPAIDDQDLLV